MILILPHTPSYSVCVDMGRRARQGKVVCRDGVVRWGKRAPGHGGDGRDRGDVRDRGDRLHRGGRVHHDMGVCRNGIDRRNSGGHHAYAASARRRAISAALGAC